MAEAKQILGGRSVGFIGGGQMSSALVKGMLAAGLVSAGQVHCSDASEAQLGPLASLGIHTTTDNKALVSACKIVILAVKPHIVPIVLKEVSSLVTKEHLIVSVAAGVTIASIAELLPEGTRVVRTMPNTPALAGAGATAFAPGPSATKEDSETVRALFQSVGVAHALPEKSLDAVTGVSGSGPAYVFAFIEAMADGGVRAGLPRDVAQSLAGQTVFGAAKLLMESGKHPGQLKDAVASPGGTTIAAIHELEKGGFRGIVMNAVVAAADRATALSAPAVPSKL